MVESKKGSIRRNNIRWYEMCEFCQKHGQGNRWYLNPDSYSDELMEDPARQKLVEEVCGHGIDYYMDLTSRVTNLARWPVLGSLVRMATRRLAPKQHGGQVVSLEDALDIVSLAGNFALIPCACRRLVAHGNEMCCLIFGPCSPGDRWRRSPLRKPGRSSGNMTGTAAYTRCSMPRSRCRYACATATCAGAHPSNSDSHTTSLKRC